MKSPLPKIFLHHFRAIPAICLMASFGALVPNASTAPSGSPNAEAAAEAAYAAMEKKDYPLALSTLATALQQRPQDPSLLNLKGAILSKQKDYDGALACYEEALKSSPDFFSARYNIGSLLALRQQWDESIAYFRNLLAEQPNNELIEYKLLLLLLVRNSDPELQRKLFTSTIPSNTPAWYFAAAARAYKNGDRRKANQLLEIARNVYGGKASIFQEELDESGLQDSKNH
jgi:tetratricopeptide (TPR) repeat protein